MKISFCSKTLENLLDSQILWFSFSPPSAVQLDQFSLLENAMSSTAGGSCFDPSSSSSSSLYYSQAALSGLGSSHGSLQEPMHMRSNMLYSNCSGGLPNIILTGESDMLVGWFGVRHRTLQVICEAPGEFWGVSSIRGIKFFICSLYKNWTSQM